MKIGDIRIRRLVGTMETQGPFWEDRQCSPLDIYADHRRLGMSEGGKQVSDTAFQIAQLFLEIETTDGHVGRAGPIWAAPAQVIRDDLSEVLKSLDSLATEALWDRMFRSSPHGRQGIGMLAISAVDCALWDLKGKILDLPVCRLLGGPTRQSVSAYASMLGHNVTDLERVRERASEMRAEGYRAQKWFFRYGPADGADGLSKNIALARTLREAVGDDDDLMFDCWQSFTYDYALRLCQELEELRPRWIEEVFLPDRVRSYSELRMKTCIPLSGGEHHYTRWGAQDLLAGRCVDVLQPDIYWCGGLSEISKIAALASTYDVPVIPHGHSTTASLHFSLAQNAHETPLLEYLTKWNAINQFFIGGAPQPDKGEVALADSAGLGMEINSDLVENDSLL